MILGDFVISQEARPNGCASFRFQLMQVACRGAVEAVRRPLCRGTGSRTGAQRNSQ
jgi:hypothetical protein